MKAIVIDLDGTLSDATKRRHWVTQKPKNFKKFYDNLINDLPNYWCLQILQKFQKDHEILLVSGRPDNYRKLTEKWLKMWNIEYKPENLLMRKEGDYRQDFIVKEEIYNEHIKDRFDVLFAVDDRKQVVDMWRSKHVPCLQCDEGLF